MQTLAHHSLLVKNTQQRRRTKRTPTKAKKHLPNATGSTQLDIINGRGMYFMAITNDKTGVQKIEKVIIN